MKQLGTVARFIAVVTVLLALSGVRSGAYAQDADGTPTADGSTDSPATYYVGATCWAVGDGSQTACSFTATASDGSPIEALWVPAWIACSDVVDSSGTEWTGDGYHVLADTLTLTFTGTVSPGGNAGYVVRVNGTPVDASGDALVCSDAPTIDNGAPEPVDQSGNTTEATGNGTTSDGGSAGNATIGDAPVVTDNSDATPEATDGGSLDEAPSAPADSEESTPSTDAAVAAQDAPTEQDVAQVDVTVVVYNCSVDPGDVDPSTSGDCEPADGLGVTATENDGTPDNETTSAGVYVFLASVGSKLVVTEDVPTDYQPIGDGSATINPVTQATTVVFVNVANDEHGDPQLGRLQIVHGSCPSSAPKDPKFIIIPPKSFQSQADEACEPTPGAVMTIAGGTLGDGSVQAITDEHGIWRGYLPPGIYTISEDAGTSPDVPIVADDLTAAVVIDYSVPPSGSLTVTKVLCTEGEKDGTKITVTANEPDDNGASCAPVNGEFTLAGEAEVTAQDAITFSLGNDGVATMTLPVGTYLLTDLDSGKSADVNLAEGATIHASVRTISLHGRLVVRHYFCADPASNDEDPTDASYWKDQCTEQQGGSLNLLNSHGHTVDTRSGKVVTWNELDAGAYSVDDDAGFCAVLAGNSDARSGFDVEPNVTTRVYVYTCAASGGGNTGGDDDGNATSGDDDGSGANDDQSGDTSNQNDQEEVASVTTLPDTGTVGAGGAGRGSEPLAFLALALPALLAGAALSRRRAR